MSRKSEQGTAPKQVTLGLALEEHVGGWVRRLERTGPWAKKSDIFDRLMAEVEKIVIRAALEKTGYVQTDTAEFLGINRNTLAKKIRRHGLQRPRR